MCEIFVVCYIICDIFVSILITDEFKGLMMQLSGIVCDIEDVALYQVSTEYGNGGLCL